MVLVVLVVLVWAASGAEVEPELLRRLGLAKRPRPDKPPVVPQPLLHLYNSAQATLHHTTSLPLPGSMIATANTVTSFSHQESDIDKRFKREDRFRLKFNVTEPRAGERVTGAELRLWGAGGRVTVHDIVRPGVKGERGPLLRLLDTVEGGQGLDVLPAVHRWHTEGHNHGLLVQVHGASSVSVRGAAGLPHRDPLLLVYSDDGRNTRTKRAVPKKRRKEPGSLCKRHPLYVDFADVGWNDWIVAPPGYDAYYCHGDCPFPLADHLNSTNHAIVQTLVNSVSPGAVPKACCVPTQLSSISLLFLDEDNRVVLKNYQDMAVVGCGCR